MNIPPIGTRVRIVESEKTSNWSRIDVGRTATVMQHKAHSFRSEHGPRLLVIIDYDEPAKHDGKSGHRGIHVSACQLEAI